MAIPSPDHRDSPCHHRRKQLRRISRAGPVPVHRRRRRQMRRRHQTPERTLLPVLAESIVDARPSHGGPQRRPLRRRGLLRAILPQRIRRDRQQKEAVLRLQTHMINTMSTKHAIWWTFSFTRTTARQTQMFDNQPLPGFTCRTDAARKTRK